MVERAEGLAAAAFASALRVLPVSIRRDHGSEMLADFRMIARRSAARGGVPALVLVLARAVADVVFRVPAEWRESRRAQARRGGLAGGKGGRKGPAELAGEVRVAIRSLRRRPAFTTAAVVTLALGIGATLAIYTVVESVVLRPLPYPDADRIVTVQHRAPGLMAVPYLENSAGTLELYRTRSRTLASVSGTDRSDRNLTGSDRPARVPMLSVTPEFFDVVQTEPALGRRFHAEDAATPTVQVAILMHGLWQDRFGGDPGVIGQVIEVDDAPVEIVGVMPATFRTPERSSVGVLLPMHLDVQRAATSFGIEGLMRLAPGVDLATAQREVTEIQPGFAEIVGGDFTPELMERSGWGADVIPLHDEIVKDVKRPLLILLGTVGVVLLIACANVANLLLVRGESRQREVTIRSALGAGRRAVAWTFMAESLVLSTMGGALAVLLSWAGVRLLVLYGPSSLPRLDETRMDGSVMLLGLVLSVAAGVLLALAPALRGLRGISPSVLRDGGARTTEGGQRHRARRALIAVQVALALVLLVGSGLMLRSFMRLRAVDPGVDVDGVTAIGVSPGSAQGKAGTTVFYQRVVDEVAALPGVEAVGATNALPLAPDGLNGSNISLRSQPGEEDDVLPPIAMYASILPGYFEAAGMELLEGRAPERADHEANRPVAWVNETFVRNFMKGGSALGDAIRFGGDSTWHEIAGVVPDVRTFGLDQDVRPMAYLMPTTPVTGIAFDLMQIVVRHSGDPGAIGAAVRAIVERLDPTVPITTVRTMSEIVAQSMARMTFTLVLLGIASIVALVLGLVGLYGAISYVVAQRTREIGIRIALGADARRVRGMVLRQWLAVVGVGLFFGLIASAAATRVLGSLLFEVGAIDPLTFIAMPLLLLAVGALAAWLPARRASNVSPLQALRAE